MPRAIVFAMTGFSLTVAAFARFREQIIPLGLTVTMIVCAIGGCWWPLYQSPPWLQQVADAFLTAWAMEGIHMSCSWRWIPDRLGLRPSRKRTRR